MEQKPKKKIIFNVKKTTEQQRQVKPKFDRKDELKQFLSGMLSLINSTPNSRSVPLRTQEERDRQHSDSLWISNFEESQENQKYGKEYLNLMDPRDIVLLHRFNLTVQLQENRERLHEADILTQSEYNQLIRKFQEFIVEVCEHVISISFNNLCQKKFTGNEAKDYAAKNIMFNLQSMMGHTLKSIKSMGLASTQNSLKLFKKRLIVDTDQILKTVLENLADYYPQAPATGGTAKMKEVILNVNRVEDEENDLICKNDIRISKYLKLQKKTGSVEYETINFVPNGQMKGQYTGFIMEVINKAITVTQNSNNSLQNRTIYQMFCEFSERLFWTSQNEKFRKAIDEEDTKIFEKRTSKKDINILRPPIAIQTKQDISRYFLSGFNIDDQQNFQIQYKGQKKEMGEIEEKALSLLKNEHKYEIGQKIPTYIKSFTKMDLKQKNFTAKSSAILRIMTKWAENLQNIFENPELMLQRVYNFKNLQNQAIIPPSNEIKYQISQKLKRQYPEIKKKFEMLRESCTFYQSQFLSDLSVNTDQFVKRYNHTRTACSKINAVLISLMHKYLNILIHHLIRAGTDISSGIQRYNINLIIFRVNDLMRSKFQCTENSFVHILKMLYLLDTPKMEQYFKLVRIKNKLESKDNNILINYLFMGRVQCELQLSIQELKEKEKNYYNFSHFVYELIRGRFGTIAEIAIMVTQHDPMISSSNSTKSKYYKPKRTKINKKKKAVQQNHLKHKKQTFESVFICSDCNELIIDEYQQILSQKKKQLKFNSCNGCLIKQNDIQLDFKQPTIDILEKYKHQIARVYNYNHLQQISYLKETILLIMNKKDGLLEPFKVWYHKREMKYFLIQLNPKIMKKDKFTSDQLHFEEITKQINRSEQIKENFILSAEMSQKLSNYLQISIDQISQFLIKFEKFRLQKILTQTIQQKHEIIYLSQDPDKCKTMDNITTNNKSQEHLFYKVNGNLNLNNIKKINAFNLSLNEIPKWITMQDDKKSVRSNRSNRTNRNNSFYCLPSLDSLTTLHLSNNNLKNIDAISKLINLNTLHVSDNSLQNIDSICTLTGLLTLNLNNNHIKDVKPISKLVNLTNLYLCSNNFTNADCLSKLSNLTQLHITNNNQLIFINLQNLYALTTLNLNHNRQLTSLDLANLENLTNLNISNNNLKDVQFLKNLQNLETLRVNNNNITKIDCIKELTNLKILYLNDNYLTDISCIKDLTKLTNVDVSKNYLKNSNQYFAKLSNLTALNLSDNVDITEVKIENKQLLSIDLSGLSKLKDLDLSILQKLEIISLSGLVNLVNLNLNTNNLTDINSLDNLRNIVKMQISSNDLSDISCISKFKTLKVVELENNEITDISCLSQLPILENLSLSSNMIQDISDLSTLTNLTILNLNFNNIKDISHLSNLTKLNSLSMNNNNLKSVDSIVKLKNLTFLDLEKNDINSIDCLSKLSNLSTLNISSNTRIESVEQLTKLQKLTDLDLSFNKDLKNIESLKKMKWLIDLKISNTGVSNINFLESLTALTKLDVGNNNIDSADVLSRLTCLNELKISHNNELSTINLANLTKLTTLKCSNVNFIDVQSLSNIANLTILDFKLNRNLTNVEGLSQLRNLITLDISKNAILRQANLYNLGDLKTLNISLNPQLQKANLSNMRSLTNLIINNNKNLKQMTLFDLNSLTNLNIVSNKQLRKVELINLQQLSDLNITSNKLLKQLKLMNMLVLKNIDLSSNKDLTSLYLSTLPLLQTLRLNSNQILIDAHLENIPKISEISLCANKQIAKINLHTLRNLAYLNFSNNNATTALSFQDTPMLQKIDLSNNALEDLHSFGNLTSLVSLNLRNTTITDIESLEKLHNLVDLDLSRNNIQNIGCLSNLTSLQILNISDNNIKNVKCLSNLVGLTSLNISNNAQLNSVDLSTLTKLTALDISNNKELTAVNLTNLIKLKTLHFNNHSLKDIECLSHLKNLETLDLSNNQKLVTANLSNFLELTILNLSNNSQLSTLILSNLPTLDTLNISENKNLVSINLSSLSNIKSLVLNNYIKLKTLKLQKLSQLQKISFKLIKTQSTPELTCSGLDKLTDIYIEKVSSKFKDAIKSKFKEANIEQAAEDQEDMGI